MGRVLLCSCPACGLFKGIIERTGCWTSWDFGLILSIYSRREWDVNIVTHFFNSDIHEQGNNNDAYENGMGLLQPVKLGAGLPCGYLVNL